MLTKKQILEADDRKFEKVKVPEWGGEVFVRVMSGWERDKYEMDMFQRRKDGESPNIRGSLCGLCIVDDKGVRIFSDGEVGELAGKSGAALDRVFDVAQRLNGIGEFEMKEFEKNLEKDQSEGSTSD